MRSSFGICVFTVLAVGLASAADMTAIFNAMNWEDKCGQMTQITYDVIDNHPFDDANPINMTMLEYAIKQKYVGSILNTVGNFAAPKAKWATVIKIIQDMAMQTRHGVPILYGIDSIHGANYIQEGTLFPQPLAAAATFNADLVSKIGHITSVETRTVGVPWNFNPVLDVGRQPLWPRLYETFGEDTRVCEVLGTAYINGHQGNGDYTNRNNTATCLKHYIGYSLPVNGRDRTNALIPENVLRETFLPPFVAGVKANSPTVMVNSGSVNGMPGHANSFYINDILKGELKFDGFAVSDWEDIVRLYTRDKLAATPEEAVRIGVMAGVDMSMVPNDFSFFDHCVSLATKGDEEFQARVNDATMRILNVKNKLGLFNGKLAYPDEANLGIIGNPEFEAVNLDAARESIVLAKNERDFLPLLKTGTQKILVTGPTGNLLRVLCGGWTYTWQGENENYYKEFGRHKLTVFDAINQKATPGGYSVTYEQGVDFNNDTTIDAAVAAAENADLIVLTIGEDTYTESPGNTGTLMLDQYQPVQITLARRLLALDKPVVVVYLGGRPRVITEIAQHNNTRAVLVGLLPGTRGSEAIADIIFGDYNPNGRMPVTYPLSPNGFTTYDITALEVSWPNEYFYLYPFGHGLSYTTFRYTYIKVQLTNDDTVSVSVTVHNIGQRAGKETVILYVNDAVASETRPLRQVKAFKKIELAVGASSNVEFTLDRWRDLSFISKDNVRVAEPGTFNVYIDELSGSFVLPAKAPISAGHTLTVGSILTFTAVLLSMALAF